MLIQLYDFFFMLKSLKIETKIYAFIGFFFTASEYIFFSYAKHLKHIQRKYSITNFAAF